MMRNNPEKSAVWSARRNAEGLRTRYRPECRINHAFFTVVPWVDTLILALCIVLAVSSRALVPGVKIELPSAVFSEGLSSDLVMVVNPLPGDHAENDDKALPIIVFFNDDRFNLGDERQVERLQESVGRYLERVGPRDALLYVDRRVAHGSVVGMVDLLRKTGVRRANLVSKAL